MPDQESKGFREMVEGGESGYEERLFHVYSARLIAFAHSRLPDRLRSRLDADDVVQSVFRSFFRRNEQGDFEFAETLDIWRLLAAMTYRKVLGTIVYHSRQVRDAGRDQVDPAEGTDHAERLADLQPTPDQINSMFDQLDWVRQQLPESGQLILDQRMEGYTVAEIAAHRQVSERTVKRVIARVKELLMMR